MPPKKEHQKTKEKEVPVKEETATDLSVGEILRRARVAEKLSLETVEEDIRIRASMLQAIENMELDRMPGWIYTLGFVRSYSEYLQLDSDKMISLLKTQVGDKQKQKLDFPVTASESAMPNRMIIGFAGAGLAIIILGIFLFQNIMGGESSSDNNVNAIPPVPIIEKYADPSVNVQETEDAPAAVNEQASVTAENNSEEEPFLGAPRDANGIVLPMKRPLRANVVEDSSDGNYRIIIDVIDESWVEISNRDGKVLVSRVLKRGDQYYVPQNIDGLMMTTGNIAGIEITVDGEKLPINGRQGDIKRDVPLDPISLKEMFL